MAPDPLLLARQHAADLPLSADPRPRTRPLADTALGALGIELLVAEPDLAVARAAVARVGGRGVLLVMAESVASTAANLHVGPDRRAFGSEINAAWTGAPAGEVIVAAVPLHVDGSLHVWRLAAIDTTGRQLLEGRCTLAVVDAPRTD